MNKIYVTYKRFKKNIARFILISFLIHLFSPSYPLQAGQQIADKSTHTKLKKDALGRKINVHPERMFGVDIKSAFEKIVLEACERAALHELPAGVLHCYASLKEGYEVDAAHLAEAFPLLIKKLLSEVQKSYEQNEALSLKAQKDPLRIGFDPLPVLQAVCSLKIEMETLIDY